MNPLRFVVGAFLLLGLGGVAQAIWKLGLKLVAAPHLLYPLLGGTIAGLVLEQVLLRKIPGFETFEHELTHAIAALLCFRRVTGFVVTARSGGWVSHSGGFGGQLADDFIGLAPYVLPTFTAASVMVRPLVPSPWFPWFDIWIGLTLGYHIWSTARETRWSWTSEVFPSAGTGELTRSDIGRRGFVFSATYIVTVTLAIHGVLLAVLLFGYRGIPAWFHLVWPVVRITFATLLALVVSLAAWVRSAAS